MAKFVEMDESVTLNDQMESQVKGPVILIEKFNVKSHEVEQFLKVWKEDATKFKDQSGFISAQLHQGIGKSTVFINYVVCESLEHFKNAVDKVMDPDLQSRLTKYPKSLVISPHLFKKFGVAGNCNE
jgi:Antibiotic biosynthesis monooxygenase